MMSFATAESIPSRQRINSILDKLQCRLGANVKPVADVCLLASDGFNGVVCQCRRCACAIPKRNKELSVPRRHELGSVLDGDLVTIDTRETEPQKELDFPRVGEVSPGDYDNAGLNRVEPVGTPLPGHLSRPGQKRSTCCARV